MKLPHCPSKMILARGTNVFFCTQSEGSPGFPHSQGGKYGTEKEVSIWGSGECPFNSASLKLERKLSLFSAAKQCGCTAHLQLDQRGQQGLVNTKPWQGGLDWMISRDPSPVPGIL